MEKLRCKCVKGLDGFTWGEIYDVEFAGRVWWAVNDYGKRVSGASESFDPIEEPVSKDLEKENKIEILADIIFNAAKHGYMPYNTQDEYCAMEIAKRNIDKFIVPKKQEEPISDDLEEAAYHNCIDRLSKESIEDFKAGAKWQKQRIMGVIQKYADKGSHMYNDFEDNDVSDTSELSYWDGFLSCAECIKREL